METTINISKTNVLNNVFGNPATEKQVAYLRVLIQKFKNYWKNSMFGEEVAEIIPMGIDKTTASELIDTMKMMLHTASKFPEMFEELSDKYFNLIDNFKKNHKVVFGY